jgi:arylsulfatase A-like enzyme
VSDDLICLTDLFATCAAIVGEPLPDDAGEDSFDILPALLGRDERRPVREDVVLHSFDGMFAIRQGPWKLIQGLGSGGFTNPRRIQAGSGDPVGQLYHLEDDPDESNNLYDKHPEVVKRLAGLLEKYRREGRSRPKN